MPWSMFRTIKSALDAEDIEGLLAIGAPRDEYDGEASQIEDGIAKATGFGRKRITPSEVAKIVRNVWNEEFGPMSDEQLEKRADAFARIAAKLVRD